MRTKPTTFIFLGATVLFICWIIGLAILTASSSSEEANKLNSIPQQRFRKLPSQISEKDSPKSSITVSQYEDSIIIVKSKTVPPFFISLYSMEQDPLRWGIFATGKYYERFNTVLVTEFLRDKPKGLVIDVGANIGWYTLMAAANGHRVYSFEPTPTTFHKLQQSIHTNRFEDLVIAHNSGVFDKKDTLDFAIYENYPGWNGLSKAGAKPGELEHILVEVDVLDDIVKVDSEEKIWFLKLDCEGCEHAALKGSQKLLMSKQIVYIMIELTPAQWQPKPVFDMLAEHGYELFSLCRYGNMTLEAMLNNSSLLQCDAFWKLPDYPSFDLDQMRESTEIERESERLAITNKCYEGFVL